MVAKKRGRPREIQEAAVLDQAEAFIIDRDLGTTFDAYAAAHTRLFRHLNKKVYREFVFYYQANLERFVGKRHRDQKSITFKKDANIREIKNKIDLFLQSETPTT